MTEPTYNWKRNWVPREGVFSFDLQGFLIPPASQAAWAKYWKTDVVELENLLRMPCLVLLGESGIGKSHAINELRRHLETDRTANKSVVLFRDLSSYTSDQLLVQELFQCPEFLTWRKEGGELHLLLDSFDECLLRVDAVAEILAAQFGRLPSIQNLFLRITSRPAEWSTYLEEALRERWGKESIGVFELAPLTRDQVQDAARVQLIEAEQFTTAVIEREVVPFAIKPITLEMLFSVWKAGGGELPPTQREIYEEGCLELCRNPEKRMTPRLCGQLSAEQRLAVASHIAAGLCFYNRAAVWTGGSHRNKPQTDISISELALGHIHMKGRRLPITEASVKETLNTGLFNSRGRSRLGWAHQTYGEFLAGRYLSHSGLTAQQVMNLVTHPQGGERKLVSQLQEAAAWASSPESVLFAHLAKVQPEVLLSSDLV